jgi:hypothetical protein
MAGLAGPLPINCLIWPSVFLPAEISVLIFSDLPDYSEWNAQVRNPSSLVISLFGSSTVNYKALSNVATFTREQVTGEIQTLFENLQGVHFCHPWKRKIQFFFS